MKAKESPACAEKVTENILNGRVAQLHSSQTESKAPEKAKTSQECHREKSTNSTKSVAEDLTLTGLRLTQEYLLQWTNNGKDQYLPTLAYSTGIMQNIQLV